LFSVSLPAEQTTMMPTSRARLSASKRAWEKVAPPKLALMRTAFLAMA
jgi:hypothetical protein